jgi:AcrR family transcriptional regulator
MSEIADASALSRATLYNYFKTKEEIFFELGIMKLDQLSKDHEEFLSSEIPGKQQILSLSESLLNEMAENPFYLKLLRRFFLRSRKLNLPIETEFYKSLVSKKEAYIKSTLKPKVKVFGKLLEKYSEYRQIWQDAIDKGIADGSIKSKLNNIHLNFIIIMIIFGIIEQIDLRPVLLDSVDFKKENVIKLTLKIIEKLLNNEI